MAETQESPLRNGLMTIHAVITRAVEVAKTHSQSMAQDASPDASLRSWFVSYVRTFVSVTHAHHLTEDELMFPYFREKILEAPSDRLTAQHREVARLLHEIKAATDEAESGSQAGEPFSRISRTATELAALWHPHIADEERIFTAERLHAAAAPDEQVRLTKLATEHSMKHSGADYLAVPFILYNLSPEARAVMSAEMPPIVVQQLVPVAWKEKWEPMSPFLLG
jgi:hemerythrin-like domain-containing protein